jgi:hypothetical protein
MRTRTGAVVPLLPGQRNANVEFDEEADFRTDREERKLDVGAPVDTWVAANSTWVNRMLWRPYPPLPNGQQGNDGRLFVEFLDLTYGYYDNIDAQTWVDFYNSSSKGRFVHDALWTIPFKKLRSGSRKVSRDMKDRREPKTAYAAQRTFRRGGKVIVR